MAHEFHSFYYDRNGREPETEDFRVARGTEMTPELMRNLIDEHEHEHKPRLERLRGAYEGRSEVFAMPRKDPSKPDNRLAADFPRCISDTFNGYFIGNPIRLAIDDPAKQAWLDAYAARSDLEDVDADIAKDCSNMGRGYELLYQDEDGLPRSCALSPLTTFVVYDDSVLKRPMFGVRYSYDDAGRLVGSYSDALTVTQFSEEGGTLAFGGSSPHYFGGVPIVQYRQNSEMRGVFEGVLSLVEAYDKALSEKANDVDYFADAYLLITSDQPLTDDQLANFRRSRIINLFGQNAERLRAEFLAKPNADGTQENLLGRLETLVFKTAMVPDISDEAFGTASGIALKMRLLPMSNLANVKERKFRASIRQRLRLLANYPNQPFSGDDWQAVEIRMTRNMPEDLASEAQLASALSGVVSEETQLSLLSVVDDPKAEMERKREDREADARSYGEGWPTNRTNEEERDAGDVQQEQQA